MRIILSTILFSLVLLSIEPVYAQNLRENEVVVIDGEKFVLHQVKTGETIYSLTKKFNVDRSVLEKYNPEITKGPSIGDILKIPLKEGADLSVGLDQKKGKPDGFSVHKVKSRRETAYFIAKEYGITVEELYEYNPDVKRFKRGEILKIPYWDTEKTEQTVEEKTGTQTEESSGEKQVISHQVASGETLYSLARKYNVSEQDILRLNPNASNLKAGAVIYIPKNDLVPGQVETTELESSAEVKYFEHIIE